MAPSTPVLTVSELNSTAAKILEHSFPLLWVSGEISNLTKAASGHWYFTLKDNNAQVRSVMFRGKTPSVGFIPKEGDKVEVRAVVTLYTARGEFQLNIEAMRHAGLGNLYEAFLRLKAKLEAEGLFDEEKKRNVPLFARTIGIITSPQAAALRDILTTLSRRAPHVNVILYPTPVQGEGAAEKIASAITLASNRAECDVLLICRGGGSIEDLWSFNEEIVARALASCSIPTISGVGHETDFTIADFAADVRAPTPTGAAEMASRAYQDWIGNLETLADHLQKAMKRLLRNASQDSDLLARRLISPSSYIEREKIRMQSLAAKLTHTNETMLASSHYQLKHFGTRLKAQLPDTGPYRSMIETGLRQMKTGIENLVKQQKQEISSLAQQLELLSTKRTLERGYAIIADKNGHIIRSPSQLPVRKPVSVQLAAGCAQISIETVQPELE